MKSRANGMKSIANPLAKISTLSTLQALCSDIYPPCWALKDVVADFNACDLSARMSIGSRRRNSGWESVERGQQTMSRLIRQRWREARDRAWTGASKRAYASGYRSYAIEDGIADADQPSSRVHGRNRDAARLGDEVYHSVASVPIDR